MAPVALVGTRKDALRRRVDAVLAAAVPGGGPLFSILSQVDGYLYPHEAVFLRRLARDLPVAPGARLLDALLRPMKSVRGG